MDLDATEQLWYLCHHLADRALKVWLTDPHLASIVWISELREEAATAEALTLQNTVDEDIETVLLEEGIDLWCWEAAEDQALAVVLPPAIDGPGPHTREIHAM